MPSRRSFLQATTLAPFLSLEASLPPPTLIKPNRLRPGDTIGLFGSGSIAFIVEEDLINK